MKKMLFALMLLCGSAAAQDVFVMTKGVPQSETVARDQIIYILYHKAKCALPIGNARNLAKAEIFNTQNPDIGCWGIAPDPGKDHVVVIGPFGHTATSSLTAFYSGKLNKDGSATIYRQAMTYEEMYRNVKKYHDSLR